MNYRTLKKIPTIEEIAKTIPLAKTVQQKISQHRQEIKHILEGKDSRLLLIIGPCSAWPQTSVLEYAKRIFQLNEKLKDVMKLVMRVYTQKPRTMIGWTGSIYQPDPVSLPNIEKGFKYSREILVKIAEIGLPIASEVVFTHYREGFLELLSWIAIGARSSENQEHRIFASSLNIPTGLKNPTSGCPKIGVCSVVSAQRQHTTMLNNFHIETYGNPYAHLVLRGGNSGPNYSIQHLETVLENMQLHQVKNPAVLIDASHDNSMVNGKKNYLLQPEIIFNIIKNLKDHPKLRSLVKGFMMESFLKDGNQKLDSKKPAEVDYEGLSITDPCLGWGKTEDFLMKLSKELRFI